MAETQFPLGRQLKINSIKVIRRAQELSGDDPKLVLGSLMLAAASAGRALEVPKDHLAKKLIEAVELMEEATERRGGGQLSEEAVDTVIEALELELSAAPDEETVERSAEAQRLAELAVAVFAQEGRTEPNVGLTACIIVLTAMARASHLSPSALADLVRESYEAVLRRSEA